MSNDVKVTKLPPGEALGVRDLQRWSHQRAQGRSGVPQTKDEREKLATCEKPKLDSTDRWLARRGKAR